MGLSLKVLGMFCGGPGQPINFQSMFAHNASTLVWLTTSTHQSEMHGQVILRPPQTYSITISLGVGAKWPAKREHPN